MDNFMYSASMEGIGHTVHSVHLVLLADFQVGMTLVGDKFVKKWIQRYELSKSDFKKVHVIGNQILVINEDEGV